LSLLLSREMVERKRLTPQNTSKRYPERDKDFQQELKNIH
jgi:hypothetical protein